jgi:5,10-methylenetetrahydromethanopterin reductase
MSRPPRIGCCLPPSKDAPALARIAEDAGYSSVLLYDSPALYTDAWMSLARIAEATSRIKIGTGVAIPALRHPMATASAIAALEELAPGRLVIGLGAGFTGRKTMGQKPSRWDDMRTYILQLRALLRGEAVEIDGGYCQMINSPGFGPERPIEVPIILAVSGPKGLAVAREVADGVFVDSRSGPVDGFDHKLLLVSGAVLRPGEDHTSPRVRAAAGAMYTTGIHGLWDAAPDKVAGVPGGSAWLSRLEAERPAAEQHLAVHEGHLVAINARDEFLLDAAGPAILTSGWTGTAEQIRARLSEAAADGVTETVVMMAGADVGQELRVFAEAAGL